MTHIETQSEGEDRASGGWTRGRLDVAHDGSEGVGTHAGLAQLHTEREGVAREVAAEHARNLGEGCKHAWGDRHRM